MHDIQESFEVVVPSDLDDSADGIDAVMRGIPVRLKQPDFEALGILVDANENLQGRWESIINRLRNEGYHTLPNTPVVGGLILDQQEKPKVGAWLMPNNQSSGILEDFVRYLIPVNDLIVPKANQYVQSVEIDELNDYPNQHHSKAVVHAWLACQENPGMPMGQAITARVLLHNTSLAEDFVDWLQRLFTESS